MKKVLILVLLTSVLRMSATPDIVSGKRYHIVCTQFANGCVADGFSLNQPTPLYHLYTATTSDETYWMMTEEEEGLYAIKNAKTGKYITYDGVRQDTPQLLRYVNMTSGMNGRYSLWTFERQSEGVYAIRNAQQTDHLWDVRVDSYCVGTYSKFDAPGANQCFSIIDEQGNKVTERLLPPTSEDGYDVSSWLVATTESPDNWTFESSEWTDPGFGAYYNGTASVVSPFLEKWNDTAAGPLPNNALSQKLQHLPAGQYLLAADIIAVRQPSSGWYNIEEETGRGVYLFAGNQRTEAGTHNEQPMHYNVSFTVGANGTVTLGLRIENTNANWIATDNIKLYYQGTAQALIAGEKAKVKAELTDYYNDAEAEALMAACNDDFDALENLRKSVALMPKADPLAKGLKNLCIGGSTVAYAESLGLYLGTISEQAFGSSPVATITYEKREGWGNLTINGTAVPSGSTYQFAKVEAGKTYKLAVSKSDGTAREGQDITFTALPVVKLYGTFNDNYSNGYIQVIEPGTETPAELMNMKAKWRGGITNSNGKHKRNYHVKLLDADGQKLEKKFFGLRNDNSWILESCQVDMSRIRNRVLTDLWNDFSTPPYYIDKEKKAMTGSRGQFVELILNGEYRGIYCMTENVDRKQMKLMKYDEATQTVHGQLWKSKDWTYATMMGTSPDGSYWPKDYLSNPNGNSDMWDQYNVKYPDTEDVSPTDWSTLYNAVDFVCHASDADFKNQVADYFDMPLVIDYYILMETILATDNHGKNMFFAVYDKQTDKKITFAVWDMDATSGQRWSDQYYHWIGMRPEQDYAQYISTQEHGDYNLFKRLRDTNPGDFNMQVRLRYRDLRNSYLATESILQRFRTYLQRFKVCGAAQREYNKWSGDTDIDRRNLDFDNEMEYLTDWFTRRMNYLDKTRFDIASLPATGISTAQTSELASGKGVYTLDGRHISDDTSSQRLRQLPNGIYIVDGRKVIVGR